MEPTDAVEPDKPRRGRPPKVHAEPVADVGPAEKPAPTEPIEWRIELRHTPVGSYARLVRTQTALTAAEAWEKFKAAVTAAVSQTQTQSGRETMRLWEGWLAEHNGQLPPQHGRIVPEADVVAIIEKARLRAPAEA